MEELKEKIKNKKAEIREKYKDVIVEICNAKGVDLGVGFDMLLAVCRGGDYLGDAQVDGEELKKDYAELVALEEDLIKTLGI